MNNVSITVIKMVFSPEFAIKIINVSPIRCGVTKGVHCECNINIKLMRYANGKAHANNIRVRCGADVMIMGPVRI